ncbi:hypothetical protein VNO77_42657 [Canavalia gladiata]|uniref:PH domain-containing protein n=1 Tax=Canavalia gladiata TaxID=3824 RepID=A0AAN9JSN5_CANGL
MIKGKEIYQVFSVLVNLYVPLILAYCSVRWRKIFTPDQCSGINRFVALFAVPFLAFYVIGSNDPTAMNLKFVAADTLQKVGILGGLILWNTFTKWGSLDWTITLFSLSTQPRTLILGVPILTAMYGDSVASLMSQIIVLQGLIWLPLMLFMYEYRSAKNRISEQLQTDAVMKENKELVQVVVKSPSFNKSCSKNLTGVKVCSVRTSRTMQKASSFNTIDNLQNSGSEEEIWKMEEKNICRSKSCNGLLIQVKVVAFLISIFAKVLLMVIAESRGKLVIDFFSFQARDPIQRAVQQELIHMIPSPKAIEDKEVGIVDGTRYPFVMEGNVEGDTNKRKQILDASDVTRLNILITCGKNLMKNPNTYASVLGITWSFISFRWNIKSPSIINGSITILSKTGLGMSMFSLGLFMALQPKIIACGKALAAMSMIVRFLVGPAVMTATSLAIGIRGVLLSISIVQRRKKRMDSLSEGGSDRCEEKGIFEYFGWVYHLGVNSVGREYCHLRFLFIRGKCVAMYKRDPHENPDINPIRQGVVGATLMVEEIGCRKVNNTDLYVIRFYNRLNETRKGEIGCATAEEAQRWIEAFDHAKQQAEYELSKGSSARDKLNQEMEIDLEGNRRKVRRYASGLRKLIRIGQGPETLVRRPSKFFGSSDGFEGDTGDALEAHQWKCVRTMSASQVALSIVTHQLLPNNTKTGVNLQRSFNEGVQYGLRFLDGKSVGFYEEVLFCISLDFFLLSMFDSIENKERDDRSERDGEGADIVGLEGRKGLEEEDTEGEKDEDGIETVTCEGTHSGINARTDYD